MFKGNEYISSQRVCENDIVPRELFENERKRQAVLYVRVAK